MTTGERIAAAMARRKMSFRTLAKKSGLHASSLHRIVHGTQESTATEVVAIATALKVPPSSLLPDSSVEARAS